MNKPRTHTLTAIAGLFPMAIRSVNNCGLNSLRADGSQTQYLYDAEECVIATATAFPRFTTPDPLTETKCWNSGYIFCGDDPINFIDPTGLDEYELRKDGTCFYVNNDADFDLICILDDNFDRISETQHYPKGTLTTSFETPVKTETRVGKHSYILIQDLKIAKEIFEFVAEYTDVEWLNCRLICKNSDETNALITTHDKSENWGLNHFMESHDNFRTIISHIHNHPSGVPIPSRGDIKNAFQLNSIYRTQCIEYEVYSAKYGLYRSYNANSIPENFIDVLTLIQCLDPQILELLKQ